MFAELRQVLFGNDSRIVQTCLGLLDKVAPVYMFHLVALRASL